MALSKSIKMYLTLFVATTCIYMVLYQYHISREPLPTPELMKNKLMLVEAAKLQSADSGPGIAAADIRNNLKRYSLFLWSPLSLITTSQSSPSPSPSPSNSSMLETLIKTTTATTPSSTTTATTKTASTPNLRSSLIITPLLSSSLPLPSLPVRPLSSSSFPSPSSSSSSLSSVTPVKSSAPALERNQTSQQNSVETLLLSLCLNSNTTDTTTATSRTTATPTTTTRRTKTMIITTPRAATTRITSTRTFNKTHIRNDNKFDNNKNNTNKMTTTTTTTISATKFAASSVPPPLYIITPTYRRPEQLAELTRLGYTLKHVANLLWLVIEDANKTSPLVTNRLDQIGVPYEYLVAPMPEEYKKTKKAKPRGVSNRNRGLQWLRQNATEGVFYFADDDNTYDVTIFEQMRYTKKVSMWPVGLVTKFGVSSPIIRKGEIVGFYDGWIGGRKYPIDMAGFAVSVHFLKERPNAKMPYKPGYEEDGFLKSLAPLNNTEIDLLASNCTEILTWHTQTKKNGAAQPLNMTKYGDTNLVTIDKSLIRS